MYVINKIFTYTFLTIFALFILVPFFYMVVTSLKKPETYGIELKTKTLNLFPSIEEMTFDNFKYILLGFADDMSFAEGFANGNFVRYFANTIFVAVCSTFITIVTTVLASFAFARLNFKGKNVLFTILLSSMMIPGEMMIITNFTTVTILGGQNTYWALIVTHAVSIFYIYYLRQTFQQIPNELFLAAKVDGYGVFKYLAKVMIPIAMPTIVTIIILSAMGSWNALIWPNLIARRQDMQMVANGLMNLFNSLEADLPIGYEIDTAPVLRMAGSLVATLPLFIFFLCFRKYIMRGVSRSGIKG